VVRASFIGLMIARYVCAVVLFVCPLVAHAQQPAWEIGPYGGWLFGQPTAIDRASENVRSFGTNGEGKSWENSAIGGLQFNGALSDRTSLSLRAAVSRTHGEFKSQYFADTDRVIKVFRLIEDVTAAHLGAVWQYSMTRHSYLGIGLSGSVRITTSALERTEPVELPLPYDTIVSGSSILTPTFSLGVPMSVGLRIDPASWLSITPEITGLIDLSELVRGGGSRALRGGASIAVLFHPSTDTEHTPEPVEIAEPEPPTLVKLHFTDEGNATNHIVARIADTTITRYVELPRTLHAKPVALHVQLNSGRDTVDLASLIRRKAGIVYRDFYRIVAERLRQDSALKLDIELAGPRDMTNQVAQSLTDFFGAKTIDSRHLNFRTRITPGQDVAITLDSASAAIAPVIGQWSERSYILPSMSLEKFIASPRGVRSWQITLSENGHVLKRWSSEDGAEPIVFPPLSLATHRLLGRLDVVDTSGRQFLDYDSLVVELPEVEADSTRPTELKEFVLLGGESRSRTWHRLLLEQVRGNAAGRTSVTVRPVNQASTQSEQIAHEILTMLPTGIYRQFTVLPEPIESDDSLYTEDAYSVTILPLP
jgi:hypothetical protein